MENAKKFDYSTKHRVKSINQALQVLEDAAEESADELKDIASRDYHTLVRTFSELKPVLKSHLKEVSSEVKQTAKKVDESVHESPWLYLGGAAATSALIGYFLGRNSRD